MVVRQAPRGQTGGVQSTQERTPHGLKDGNKSSRIDARKLTELLRGNQL